jgi:sugar lactone lactonase YvrE
MLISPSASSATNTGLANVNGLALSPDGTSLYTDSSTADAVAQLAIEPTPIPPAPVNPPATKKKKCKKHKKKKKHAAESKKKCKKKKKKGK